MDTGQAAAMALGAERERRRLADALHDTAIQDLVLARILIDRAVQEGSIDTLSRVQSLLDSSMAQLRSLLCNLCSPVQSQDGLVPALKGLADELCQRWQLAHCCRLTGQVIPLPEPCSELLFYGAREFINNVGRHARARSFDVTLAFADDSVGLTVCDDGIGITCPLQPAAQEPLKGGYGLFSLRARVEPLGGKVVVRSGAAGGTVAILSIPLPPRRRAHRAMSRRRAS